MLIWNEYEAQVLRALEEIAPGRDFGPRRVLAITDGEKLRGGVVVHDWNPEAGTVEISGAALPGMQVRSAAREVARLVFGVMGCQAVILRTAETNTAARRLARAMGGQENIIPRLRGRAASEALIVITQEAWQSSRWAA